MLTEREQLLANVRLALLGINGASPFTSDIQEVSRDIKTPEQFEKSLPAIVMIPGPEEEVDPGRSNQSRFFWLPIMLLLYVEGDRRDEPLDMQINDVCGDIVYAMTQGPERYHAGFAALTHFQSWDTTAIFGEGTPGAVLEFRSMYRNTWTSP